MGKEKNWAFGWFQRVVIALIALMPIWFAPVRTAPIAFHVSAWIVLLLAGLSYYIAYRETMPTRTRNLCITLLAMIIGAGFAAIALWDLIPGLGDEGKLVGFYLINAITLWFTLTHRNEDGAVQWLKGS